MLVIMEGHMHTMISFENIDYNICYLVAIIVIKYLDAARISVVSFKFQHSSIYFWSVYISML